MPLSLMQEFKEKFGVTVLPEGYGCTELSPAAIVNVPDWQSGNLRQLGNKPGTIGQPVPGVAVRIVHKETFQDQPAGQEGMLLVYGANVMKGYLGNDALTKKKIIDGWYITGDLAKMDEDGFVTITGREERFAKVGGEMVPLEKVEEEIQTVLGESQDRLVVVTAIADAKRGERIVVLHLPLETAPKDVAKKLGERGLPNIYLPDARDFYQVAELPILGSGKIDLKKMQTDGGRTGREGFSPGSENLGIHGHEKAQQSTKKEERAELADPFLVLLCFLWQKRTEYGSLPHRPGRNALSWQSWRHGARHAQLWLARSRAGRAACKSRRSPGAAHVHAW